MKITDMRHLNIKTVEPELTFKEWMLIEEHIWPYSTKGLTASEGKEILEEIMTQ